MLKRLSVEWKFEKQKNVLLRIVAILSLVFGGVYLTLAIISCFEEPWTWILQISPTIHLLWYEVISWRIDRVILIITGCLITALLIKEVGKEQEESVPSTLINIEEIVDILGVLVMVCFIIWETFQTIVKLLFIGGGVPDPYTEGMFLDLNFGSKDIVIFLSIFCTLFLFQTATDIIKKKYSKKNNSLFLIMFVFFVIILISYIIELVWSVDNKQIYIIDYFLKTIGYLWVGITSLQITKKKARQV